MDTFSASNLTRGKGGLSEYTNQDWVRALKQGLGKDQKTLIGMPSQEFSNLTEKDLAALIAYCQNQPPVDKHRIHFYTGRSLD